MDRIATTGVNAKSLKEQAKKIKREQGIPHHEALEIAAKNAGFTNWKNFLNNYQAEKASVKRPRPAMNLTVPRPAVIGYYPALTSVRHLRPNARMPVAAHQKIGALLKRLKNAAENHKRAVQPIKDVAYYLDEWVQKEYSGAYSHLLSNEVFFDLYYGDESTPAEVAPSMKRKTELKWFCRQVKNQLAQHYHDCGPLRDLLRKMDMAIRWLDKWPAVPTEKKYLRRTTTIPSGSLVYIQTKKRPAVVISHQVQNGVLVCQTNDKLTTVNREQVTVPRDQSGAAQFWPLRLWLPYGKFTDKDGTEFLVNRDYQSIWMRTKDGLVYETQVKHFVDKNSESDFYFNDGSAPWHGNRTTIDKCLAVLEEWGVKQCKNALLKQLEMAIESNDASLLYKSNS